MKRSIIISLLAVLTTDALGCAIPGTHNYYLFSTVGKQDWQQSTDARCMDNWRAYAGKQDLYWFDADEMAQIAQKKGDALMKSYITQLQKYLEVASKTRETWEYPSKQELARRQQILSSVRQYALSKTGTRLRSQHALLYMRCNMMMGRHGENVTFWEKTATKYINSVYRDMMRNIYAGALLKVGRTDEATQIFMEQGDIESLYTYYYKKRSCESIEAEYQRNPNSPAMPFLLQDFANNAQEAIDAQVEGNFPGKLYVYDVKKAEAMRLCKLAKLVVTEGKTQNPALWKSLEAWLQYLFGDRKLAMTAITEATQMEGTPRIKDNVHVLRLFISASEQQPGEALDRELAAELTWLEDKAREERQQEQGYENHYTRVYDRLVHQVLVPKYDRAGCHDVATAFLSVYSEQPKVFYMTQEKQFSRNDSYGWNSDYSTDCFQRIDTMPVAQLESYLNYTQQQPRTALDKWLLARIHNDAEFLHELIGTKYLRLCQWADAEKHFSQVSVDFINHMNIAPFMAQRSYQVEPWMNRQRLSMARQEPGAARVSRNQKLDYVREMQQLEQGFSTLKADLQAERAYQLAIRYAQASYAGDAWYLTRYGKSCMEEPREDEVNLLLKADEMLKTARSIDNFALKEKVLFALAYLPVDNWQSEEWDDEKATFVSVVYPTSHQYLALQALAAFEKENATRTSGYVSRCDVLKQFLKAVQ
jgi:hypothetical protein